jgi:hypothetical protein
MNICVKTAICWFEHVDVVLTLCICVSNTYCLSYWLPEVSNGLLHFMQANAWMVLQKMPQLHPSKSLPIHYL